MGVAHLAVAALPSVLPPALVSLPTALLVAVLCSGVVAEIVVVPGVLLPGGTMTLLAGALIGAGRPTIEVAVPMIVAVLAGDQLAFFSGGAVIAWWRRRHPERAASATRARRGRATKWLTATMPSIAGAARMPYREFAPRLLVIRVPWLAGALSVGSLAARSLRETSHIAGIVGLVASVVVIAGLVLAHRRSRSR
ncbi:MAG: hypothetical protein J2P25_16895 [Nocardiopsaceae bacterium]|nr:hypothetical protein [Nocardiopsaceae bacterium]